jgi:hypothetical protein
MSKVSTIFVLDFDPKTSGPIKRRVCRESRPVKGVYLCPWVVRRV